MSRLTKSHREHLAERLTTPEDVAAYVNAAIEEGDIKVLLLALRYVVEVRGVASVAAQAGLNRENAYRMLSEEGNPRLSSLFALLAALGLELWVRPAQPHRKARAVVASASIESKVNHRAGATSATRKRP